MKNCKLVIFDMGNTLINFHAGLHTDEEKDQLGLENMHHHLWKYHQCFVPVETLKKEFLDIWYSDFYLRAQLIELDVTAYLKPLLEKYNLQVDGEAYLRLMSEFYKIYREEAVVHHSALKILKSLHESGTKIAVASNCILFDEIYEAVFEDKGMKQFIDKFVFSYSRGYRKPDLRIFKEIIDSFGFKNEEILMVGDSLNADIIPANQLGLKTVWINKKSEKNSCADIEITNFDGLSKVLLGV